jgi:hypothetical protein
MTDTVALESGLATPLVFLDTQALRIEKLDWNGKRLAKLKELAKGPHVTILTTAITQKEIKGQAAELLAEARKLGGKSGAVLSLLGHEDAVRALEAPDAIVKLEGAMDSWFSEAKAVDVPISVTVEELFAAYFDRKPPFTDKKKHEFPDAAVVASLEAWCKSRKAKAYVVSADGDMKACCAKSEWLIAIDSVADVLTLAAVSQEFLDALFDALEHNETLSDRLADHMREDEVEAPRYSYMSNVSRVTGKVDSVEDINIFSVEVVEREGPRLTLEVSFEAALLLDLEIEMEGEYGYDQDDYRPPYRFGRHKTIHRISYAEVILSAFDPKKPDEIEMESVYTSPRPIELRPDDIPSPRDGW